MRLFGLRACVGQAHRRCRLVQYIRHQEGNDQKSDQNRLFGHQYQVYQRNYRFERFTREASGFAGGDSLISLDLTPPPGIYYVTHSM